MMADGRFCAIGMAAAIVAGGVIGTRALADGASDAVAPAPNAAAVESALERATSFLRTTQGRNGTWRSVREHRTTHDATAVAAYAKLRGGVPLSDHRLQRAVIPFFDRTNVVTVFARSYSLLLWNALGPDRFRSHIEDDVRFLRIQQAEGGGWGFGTIAEVGPGERWQDNEHTALVLQALGRSRLTGVEVSKRLWQRAEKSWLASQNDDGGWGFPLVDDPELPAISSASYGTMTAAALASLQLLYDAQYLDEALPFNGRFKARCGEDAHVSRELRASMDRGLTWWEKHFGVDDVPFAQTPTETSGGSLPPSSMNELRNSSLPFYLYQVARYGRLSGTKRFGERAWYPALAAQLLAKQRPEGAWGDVFDTSFAVLSLAEGGSPVLINKLKWDGEWNLDPRDAINLSRWYERRYGDEAAWQIVDLRGDHDDLFDAPVLYVNGHEAPSLTDEQQARIRTFVHSGGTLLAVACCSREAFATEAKALFASILPDQTVGAVAEDHPLWRIGDRLEADDSVIAFDDGCRITAVILPNAACCAWQQNRVDDYPDRFRVGGNVLRYATFRRRPSHRLSPYLSLPRTAAAQALTVTRLHHDGLSGMHDADPDALRHLSTYLARELEWGIDKQAPITAEALAESNVDVIWITGHDFKPPSAKGQQALKEYIGRGGTVLATACCGRKAFDESFRPFAAALFGGDAWAALPADHPIVKGSVAGDRRPLDKPALRRRIDGPAPARLDRAVLFGVRRDDRWPLIYSPYDINCGITGHNCPTCVGYVPADARAIARNLMLYVRERKDGAEETSEAPE